MQSLETSCRSVCLYIGCFVIAFSRCQAEIPEEWIEGLADEQFDERDTAENKIASWVAADQDGRLQFVLEKFKDSDDPEVRARLTGILNRVSDDDYMRSGTSYLGIHMGDLVPLKDDAEKAEFGIPIIAIMPDSPAESADLEPGDIIVSLDGESWNARDARKIFTETVSGMRPLTEIELALRRDEKDMTIKVILGKRPIQNLMMADGRLGELDKAAKDQHFEKWLAERLLPE